jgi:hypothetical protein
MKEQILKLLDAWKEKEPLECSKVTKTPECEKYTGGII